MNTPQTSCTQRTTNEGWMVRIKIERIKDLDSLLIADAYTLLITA